MVQMLKKHLFSSQAFSFKGKQKNFSLGVFLFITFFSVAPLSAIVSTLEKGGEKKETVLKEYSHKGDEQKFSEKFYNAQKFTLKNGLRVFLIEHHRTPVVSQMVVYRIGSADDPIGKSGLAHFTEHLMFKGPKGSDPERIMSDAETVGGMVNASTGYDTTQYYEIVPKEHIEHFMKLEASRMRNLPVRAEDVTPEISVVLEEENMRYGNNPYTQFYFDLRAAFFRHHPYQTRPIGYRSEIKTYTPEDVDSFHKKHYGPNNAFVILSGDMTLPEAKRLMEKYYGDIPARGGWSDHGRGRVKEPELKIDIILNKKSDQVALPYIFELMPAPDYTPQNRTEAEALSVGFFALTNTLTGILYRRLVEELKVATFINISSNYLRMDDDPIFLNMQTAKGVSLEKLEKTFKEELNKILDLGLSEQQLKDYKIQMLAGVAFVKDSLMAGAGDLISPLISEVPLARTEAVSELVHNINVDEINTALRKYLRPKHSVKGYLLPEQKKKVKSSEVKALQKQLPQKKFTRKIGPLKTRTEK